MKILILANDDIGLYNFRHDLIRELLSRKYKVIISVPYGEKVDLLRAEGCSIYSTMVDRRGTNIWEDIKLFLTYWKIIKREMPEVVLSYTVKPNIYGGIAAKINKVPYVTNITGLGSSIQNRGVVQKLVLFLYKIALKKAVCVFFQNEENMDFFIREKICESNYGILPGSGVNIEEYQLQEYPIEGNAFAFVGRIMKEKGIEEYLYAAKKIKETYSNTQFYIYGSCEEEYLKIIEKFQEEGIVIFQEWVSDMRAIYKKMNCIVVPSYHEGMSNVLLEAAASGRPSIASNISGCKEIIEHGKTGLLFEKRSKEQLCEMIETFLEMSYEDRKEMGLAARKKVKEGFDRRIIIKKYLDVIKELSR